MVNRRTTKFSHLAEQESISSFLRSENQSLRKKNEDLAKALSDAKIEQQKLIETTFELQKRLFSTDTEKLKYEEFLRAQSVEMQNYIQQFFLLTEEMTSMLSRIKMVAHSPQALDQFNSNLLPEQNLSTSSTHSNKTMAVMPMISGHTILSPKVNLPRVTVKQLTDMMHTNSSEHIENANAETDEIEFADNVSSNQEDLSEGSFESNGPQSNRRLETLQEIDTEEEQGSINNSQPLLSGVFKDIQVFISPLSPQHLIKFKHKTPRKFGQNSFNNIPSSSVRSPANNTGDNSTLTPMKSSMSRSDCTTDNSGNVTKIKKSTTPLPINFNNLSNTNTEDYDPMEGPSNLWRYTQDVGASIFQPAPNETSTPYSLQIPQSSSVSEDGSGTPTTPLKHVTRRKVNSNRSTTSSKLSNCCVRLEKLSRDTLNSLSSLSNSKNDPVSSKKSANFTRKGRNKQSGSPLSQNNETVSSKKVRRRRDDSPTVLERSRSNGSMDHSERRRSSSSFNSPKVRRARRKLTPGSYKEPSLNKKMRR